MQIAKKKNNLCPCLSFSVSFLNHATSIDTALTVFLREQTGVYVQCIQFKLLCCTEHFNVFFYQVDKLSKSTSGTYVTYAC